MKMYTIILQFRNLTERLPVGDRKLELAMNDRPIEQGMKVHARMDGARGGTRIPRCIDNN